ncbi:MAG: IS66 family transposase [Methylocella sp.]
MRACRVRLRSVAREESRAERTAEEKSAVVRLTHFVDDGCLKMRNNAAERAIRPIALGGTNFLRVPPPAAARTSKPTPGQRCTAQFHRRSARTS